MSKQILYLGNKLVLKNRNLTTIEQLSLGLKTLSYQVETYSDKNNKLGRLLSMLWAIIKHRDFDYLLIDTYSTSAFWFAWFSAQLARVVNLKYILILHGGNLPQRLKKNPKLCHTLFSKAYINIAPSNYLFQKFKTQGFDNLKLIPNTIEVKNYNFKKRGELKPHLLWVRAFADIYNPLLALKVLKELINVFPEAKLSMVGPFKDESINLCKDFAKLHQLPVTFTGKLPKKDWLNYAEDFDVFLNTTNVDNTPVSVIEAMALGLPIVSTNVGGLPYLLNHRKDSLLVDANDKEAMLEAILNLLQKPKLAQTLSENGRKLAERFDWEVVKHQWKEVLK